MPLGLERLRYILIERHAHDLGSLHGVSAVEHRDDVLGNAVDHRDRLPRTLTKQYLLSGENESQ